MPKIVESMLKAFKREKIGREKSKSSSGSKRGKKSVLDADSFVFMPGDGGGQYWGEILNDENFPVPQMGGRDSRRKTHIGFVDSDESNGIQEVNLIIRANTNNTDQEKDDSTIMNGKVYNRRYSGTLVKANKCTDENDDGPVLRDYAFLLTARERKSQDLSGRYVYDRLIRSPLQPRHPPPPPPPSTKSPSQWQYPRERKNSADFKIMSTTEQDRVQPGPKCSTPTRLRSDDVLREDHGHLTCNVYKHESLKGTHNYSDLEPPRSVNGSGYAMPADALNWELNLEDLDQYEVVPMREYRTIPPQDLMLGDKIGEGQFGDVRCGYLYPKTMDEIEVAIKTCKPDAPNEDKSKFLQEALVMCKFKHPNIIKLYGVVSYMDLAYIVMELAPHGQLRRYLLTEGSRITRLMLLNYVAQLASAMVHLEDMNYVHRDIAARNVLVCNAHTIKLADFGLSRGLEDGDYYVASRGKLPIKWMAPESINFRRFTGLSDVWMFGVCCWEILMRGVKPFVGIKNDEVIDKIEMGERLPLPIECPSPLFAVMNMCWKYDPLERPRFVDIEARILEIIDEETELEQMSNRRFNSGPGMPIQKDPNAPMKPSRNPDVGWASSNSSGGDRTTPISDLHQMMTHSEQVEGTGEDLPPLPPRAVERFRDLSTSPPLFGDGGGGDSNSPIPPTRKSQPPHEQHLASRENRPLPNHPSGPSHKVPPYSVTTISAQEDSRGHVVTQQRSDSPFESYQTSSHIPPPAILSQHPNHQAGESESGIYYSTPSEMVDRKKQHRVLTKDGVFISQDVDSLSGGSANGIGDRDQGIRPKLGEGRPISHTSTDASSGRSSPASSEGRRYPGGSEVVEKDFTIPDEDDTLKLTTGVVKSIKELSDKVHKLKPSDYVDLVKNVGLALRDLLGKVDESLNELPQETHTEVLMAQKVLSSDMTHLVSAMKDAQTHYDRLLEQEYQKKMLKAAHVVAVNSKLLLDAINSAKRKAQLMR